MKKTIFAIMALMILGLVVSVSAITPATVTGYVYGADHTTPVEGATVTATCNGHAATAVSSDADGSYYVIFDSAVCGFNAPVTVTAVKDGQNGVGNGFTCALSENKDTDCEIPVALVDVSIPEFGVIAGAVALVGALGIFLYRRN